MRTSLFLRHSKRFLSDAIARILNTLAQKNYIETAPVTMHPSPASNLLNRRSITAYSIYFREEQRRLFEEPISDAVPPTSTNRGPPR